MSAPRTMSEIRLGDLGAEIDAAQAHDTERGMRAVAAELWDAVTAERAAFTALEQEYAQAVRALRLLERMRHGDGVLCSYCGCGTAIVPGAPPLRERHSAACRLNAVLSTPRAQAVKEVE